MLAALLTAMQTLTSIPVPSPREAPAGRVLAWSAVFYPVVGLLIGGLGVATYEVIGGRLPPNVTALLILAVWAVVTGALHEDGLADTFDAFGSQRSRQDILHVLKDSRVGSYGVVAVVLAILLRWQLLALLPESQIHFALLTSQVLPRSALPLLAYTGGPATQGSGGSFAAGLTLPPVTAALVTGSAIAVALRGEATLVPVLICIAASTLLGLYFRNRIGGVTGDCLGAGEQIQEIGVLLALLVSASK